MTSICIATRFLHMLFRENYRGRGRMFPIPSRIVIRRRRVRKRRKTPGTRSCHRRNELCRGLEVLSAGYCLSLRRIFDVPVVICERHPISSHARQREKRSQPRASVFALPDNSRPRTLETLLCRTFTGTAEERCIDDYFVCVRAPVRRPERGRVHAWPATKPDPHLSVGVAAKNGYWDFNDAVFADLRDSVQKV